jgi:hypothetical protein
VPALLRGAAPRQEGYSGLLRAVVPTGLVALKISAYVHLAETTPAVTELTIRAIAGVSIR